MQTLVRTHLFLLSLLYASFSLAQISAEKKELVDELMSIYGTEFIGDQLAQDVAYQIQLQFEDAGLELDYQIYEIISSVASELVYEHFIANGDQSELNYSSWGTLFNEKELAALIDFYSSETGRLVLDRLPKVEQINAEGLIGLEARILPLFSQKLDARLKVAGFDADYFDQLAIRTVKPRIELTESELQELRNQVCSEASPEKRRPVHRPMPVYPHEARQLGVEGFVDLQFDVNPDGSTSNVQVLKATSGTIFNDYAIAAAEMYVYCPASTVTTTEVRVRFEMEKEAPEVVRESSRIPANPLSDKDRYAFIHSSKFQSFFEKFAKKSARKAIHIASDGGEKYVHGWAANYRSNEDAIINSLVSCERLRTRKKVKSKCELLVQDSNLSWKFQNIDSVRSVLVDHIDPEASELSDFENFIKYYQGIVATKAMALAENDKGQWFLKEGYSGDSQEHANKEAVRLCDEKRPEWMSERCGLYMIDNYLLNQVPKMASMRGLWRGEVTQTIHFKGELEAESHKTTIELNNCGAYPILSMKEADKEEFGWIHRIFSANESASNTVLTSVVDGTHWVETQIYSFVELDDNTATLTRSRQVSNPGAEMEEQQRNFGLVGSGMITRVQDGCSDYALHSPLSKQGK